MFTFYDNTRGLQEEAWNICWNENREKWITFYSWMPSYAANIDLPPVCFLSIVMIYP